MKEISEIDRAYIAGFFDGDGCISGRIPLSDYPTCLLTISQRDPEILYYIRDLVGIGEVYVGKVKDINWSRFRISKAIEIKRFIEIIYPYCIVKKNQLRIACSFINLIGRKQSHNAKNKERRMVYYKKLKELKKVAYL